MFPATVTAQLERAEALLKAMVRFAMAHAAGGVVTYFVPVIVPGGKPVTDVPGLSPRSPVMAVAPVLVIVLLARTANGAAEARRTGTCPHFAAGVIWAPALVEESAIRDVGEDPAVRAAVNATVPMKSERTIRMLNAIVPTRFGTIVILGSVFGPSTKSSTRTSRDIESLNPNSAKERATLRAL
jgi:hypothetical protein